ncbi:hypothetical protein G3M48_004517 [Beauveria asiatica]|uniref:Uncharacterized protein n=1 Tax=Beauveria asiatica TaxID=1069075 RepID=A0AAW0RTR7_9HYPO
MVQIVGKEVATTVHHLLGGKEKLAAFAMARGDTTSDFFEATLRMCFVKSTLTFWRRLAEQVPSVETTEEAVGVLPQAARRRQERLHAERRTDGEICGGGCRELAAEFETRRARETPTMFPPNTRK